MGGYDWRARDAIWVGSIPLVLALDFMSVASSLDGMDAGFDPAEIAGRGVAQAVVSVRIETRGGSVAEFALRRTIGVATCKRAGTEFDHRVRNPNQSYSSSGYVHERVHNVQAVLQSVDQSVKSLGVQRCTFVDVSKSVAYIGLGFRCHDYRVLLHFSEIPCSLPRASRNLRIGRPWPRLACSRPLLTLRILSSISWSSSSFW